jgi:hypothetical protein
LSIKRITQKPCVVIYLGIADLDEELEEGAASGRSATTDASSRLPGWKRDLRAWKVMESLVIVPEDVESC